MKNALMEHLRYIHRAKQREKKPKRDIWYLKERKEQFKNLTDR